MDVIQLSVRVPSLSQAKSTSYSLFIGVYDELGCCAETIDIISIESIKKEWFLNFFHLTLSISLKISFTTRGVNWWSQLNCHSTELKMDILSLSL